MKFFVSYLKQKLKKAYIPLLFLLIFTVSFVLYHLPAGAVIYPALLCSILGLLFSISSFLKARRKHLTLLEIQKMSAELIDSFPPEESIDDADYQEIIRLLCEEHRTLKNDMTARYSDMVDYYTIWAHQIKTPIASMHLTLQNEDSPLSRRLAGDLFRIEQYVEMVLVFLRLDSDFTDYIIREYDLDVIVRQTVRKFAGEFISRKLSLEYSPLNATVITDEKWLSFVIEQVLSNALKYTPKGSITIYLEAPKTLCIADTGIGIAPEDLPRIFDKGYTGYNGHSDKKASGIGLYLSKRICTNLGHTITAESKLDCGTVIRIDLMRDKLEIE